MDEYASVKKSTLKTYLQNDMKVLEAEQIELLTKDKEFNKLNELYDECLNYLKDENMDDESIEERTNGSRNGRDSADLDYESIEEYKGKEREIDETEDYNKNESVIEKKEVYNSKEKELEESKVNMEQEVIEEMPRPKIVYKIENEQKNGSVTSVVSEPKSDRLRKLSQQLPKIIITQSNNSLNVRRHDDVVVRYDFNVKSVEKEDREEKVVHVPNWQKKPSSKHINNSKKPLKRARAGYGDFPKRLVSKRGLENVALISNVPFEKFRLLNDTFHTLINLRWRWIVTGTIVVHFAIWLVFAIFWYITALAHYDFEPDPPKRSCITGGHDFLTIFLASVEAQTTIGFGDRAIDEECPESIFLFIMQLILGTGLSGVLTCVVYAKLTRPEKLSRDGVGFSKRAVLSMRDGRLCLMVRAWDLNYDHIISSQFTAHFVHTHRTKEGEIIRYYAESLRLQQRQFLLWPVTLVHVIDVTSPLYRYGPEHISNSNYEITVSLKGASASMGTFTQSQTSYLPKEVLWGHRFPGVVRYDVHKHAYAIDHKKLDVTEPVDTPFCSAHEIEHSGQESEPPRAGTPSSFSDQISSFQLGRSSSFRNKPSRALGLIAYNHSVKKE